MYRYSAYGLSLCSALPLPELQPSFTEETNVTISFSQLNWQPPEEDTDWRYFDVQGREIYLYWKSVGKFLVRAGQEIVIDPLPGAEAFLIRLPLLGSVLATLLHQRGILVLHASAIAIHGSVAVFVGAKGQGKSTMAAALCSRGHHLLADDVAAIEIKQAEQPIVLPGFPQMKLWPEAAIATLGDDPALLKRVHPEVEKRTRSTVESFIPAALPLRRIYVLCQGSTPRISPLQPQDALAKLIANSYMAYLLGNKFLHTNTSLHLHQCAKLASPSIVSSLERPRFLDLLSHSTQLVEADFSDAISSIKT